MTATSTLLLPVIDPTTEIHVQPVRSRFARQCPQCSAAVLLDAVARTCPSCFILLPGNYTVFDGLSESSSGRSPGTRCL